MFKLEKMKSILWPVTVNEPRDGGTFAKSCFNLKFELLPGGEFNAIYKSGGNDEDLLRRSVIGFGLDLIDESGAPISFTQENLELLISKPYVRNAMIEAYLELSQGKKAEAKN